MTESPSPIEIGIEEMKMQALVTGATYYAAQMLDTYQEPARDPQIKDLLGGYLNGECSLEEVRSKIAKACRVRAFDTLSAGVAAIVKTRKVNTMGFAIEAAIQDIREVTSGILTVDQRDASDAEKRMRNAL